MVIKNMVFISILLVVAFIGDSVVIPPPEAQVQCSQNHQKNGLRVFTICDHPFYRLPLETKGVNPVSVFSYNWYDATKQSVQYDGGLYAPRSATLDFSSFKGHGSFKSLDIVFFPALRQNSFGIIHLNRRVRVFFVMWGSAFYNDNDDFEVKYTTTFKQKDVRRYKLSKATLVSLQKTTGTESEEEPELGVFFENKRYCNEENNTSSGVFGVEKRHGCFFTEVGRAVVVEAMVSSNTVEVPGSSMISINGKSPTRICVVLADVDIQHPRRAQSTAHLPFPDLKSFSPPIHPDLATFGNLVDGAHWMDEGSGEQPKRNFTPPIPNKSCPKWVHDLYVTRFEGKLFRTWHPMIDPVYWCYFNHEHGAFIDDSDPYGYVASKNLDENGNGQVESNQGFKTFVFRVGGADNRIVSLSLHAHMAHSRRFNVRFHTGIISVYRPAQQSMLNLEMKLQVKLDFGAAMAVIRTTQNERELVYLSEDEEELDREIRQSERIIAFRRFNVGPVLNDSDVSSQPQTVSMQSLSPEPRMEKLDETHASLEFFSDLYETWVTSFPCMQNEEQKEVSSGFEVQFRDPSTELNPQLLLQTTDETIHRMPHHSVNRVIKVGQPLQISTDSCYLRGSTNSTSIPNNGTGTFYTDVKFREIHPGPGPSSVRQFIKPGFIPLKLRKGFYVPVHTYGGFSKFEPDQDAVVSSINVELAAQGASN